MPGLVSELKILSTALYAEHGRAIVSAAALLLISKNLFSRVPDLDADEIERLLRLQRACVAAWLSAEGVAPDRVENAVVGLERARVTANYLASLPP